MALQWTESLSTGIELIDTQHKELIGRLNNLLEACQQGKGRKELSSFIGFLADYVIMHFSEEEKHMIKYGYDDYSAHKEQHELFLKDFRALRERFDTQGAGINLVLLTNRTVVDWLVNHINKTDKALGVFLKDKIS